MDLRPARATSMAPTPQQQHLAHTMAAGPLAGGTLSGGAGLSGAGSSMGGPSLGVGMAAHAAPASRAHMPAHAPTHPTHGAVGAMQPTSSAGTMTGALASHAPSAPVAMHGAPSMYGTPTMAAAGGLPAGTMGGLPMTAGAGGGVGAAHGGMMPSAGMPQHGHPHAMGHPHGMAAPGALGPGMMPEAGDVGMAEAVPHEKMQLALDAFWEQQRKEAAETSQHLDANSFKTNNDLPLARIKRIMKSDEDVRMIRAETPVLFAKACELFILELTIRAWCFADKNKRRNLHKEDVQAAVAHTEIFDFLVEVINTPPPAPAHLPHPDASAGHSMAGHGARGHGHPATGAAQGHHGVLHG